MIVSTVLTVNTVPTTAFRLSVLLRQFMAGFDLLETGPVAITATL